MNEHEPTTEEIGAAVDEVREALCKISNAAPTLALPSDRDIFAAVVVGYYNRGWQAGYRQARAVPVEVPACEPRGSRRRR